MLAVAPGEADRILADQPLDVPLTAIGTLVSQPGFWQQTGTEAPLYSVPRGYEHYEQHASSRMHIAATCRTPIASDRCLRSRFRIAPAVALCGALGLGKTGLVQAIAAACGVPPRTGGEPHLRPVPRIPRPPSALSSRHLRLAGEREFQQLGPEEYFDSSAIPLTEWADRFPGLLPPERISI